MSKSKKEKLEQVIVPKSRIVASMPHKLPKDGSNPQPVLYNNGVIYTVCKTRKFRALATRGDRYSETSKAWGADKPTEAAWVAAVKSIETKNKNVKKSSK